MRADDVTLRWICAHGYRKLPQLHPFVTHSPHNLQPDSMTETVFTALHYHKNLYPSIEPALNCCKSFLLNILLAGFPRLHFGFQHRLFIFSSASSLCTHDKLSGCGAALPPAQANANRQRYSRHKLWPGG